MAAMEGFCMRAGGNLANLAEIMTYMSEKVLTNSPDTLYSQLQGKEVLKWQKLIVSNAEPRGKSAALPRFP